VKSLTKTFSQTWLAFIEPHGTQLTQVGLEARMFHLGDEQSCACHVGGVKDQRLTAHDNW
jgi:hypothetical protein